MQTITPIQRAMLQLKQHADFKDESNPHDKAKADAYRHALQVVRLFTGEELPAQAAPRLDTAFAMETAPLPGLALAAIS